MLSFRTTLIILLTLSACPSFATDELLDAGRTASIDFILEKGITNGLIAGGVVVIGNHKDILFSTSHGKLNSRLDAPVLSERTIFDIASLTKVFATAPALMKLLEERRISLVDPITRWFPEFGGSGLESITILNLLTHSSGLEDIAISNDEPIRTIMQRVALQKNGKMPGSRFHYADINFILLGELVQRVTGLSLDRYCQDRFYNLLGMSDTLFLPPKELAVNIAPTLGPGRLLVAGIVQDENARHLGGVAGHAGLFSSASDMVHFIQMMLGGGILNGKQIFSEQVVTQMTVPYFYNNGKVIRGLGWDIYSPFSAPKTSSFSDMSFGHTGYSGSSIWIDPQRDLFVIMLTTRLDYRVKKFNRLRSDISTLAVSIFSNRNEGTLFQSR
ncbi:MAG TPA: serine hydrolase domain-containing protein [Desulfuromonadaceae bacterium]